MKDEITIPGKTYAVTSARGCTVTTTDGTTLVEAEAAPQSYFVAEGGRVTLSDDSAILTELFKLAPIALGGGGKPAAATLSLLALAGAVASKHWCLFYAAKPPRLEKNAAVFLRGVCTYGVYNKSNAAITPP